MALSGLQMGILKYRQAVIRKDIKRAIKEGVPEDELVDFRFHIEEDSFINLEWTKPKKEFRFNQQMYDVVETRQNKDTIYYKCIHDVKESGLFQQIDKMANNRTNKETSVVKFLHHQFYFHEAISFSLKHSASILENKDNIAFKNLFYQLFAEPPIPPPPKDLVS